MQWSAELDAEGRRTRRMDETELRIGVLELLMIEMMPWLDPQILEDAKASIEAGLPGAGDEDETTVRRGAAGLIEDAQKRFRRP